MYKSVDDIKRKAAEEIARVERGEKIRAALPIVAGLPWRIFCHREHAWAELKRDESYQPHGSPARVVPSLETVAMLAPLLEPLPLVIYQSGCTSIQPYTDKPPTGSQPDDGQPIAPFTLEAEGTASYRHQATVTVRWWTRVAGETVRISIEMPEPFDGNLGRVETKRAGHNARGMREGDIISVRYVPPPTLAAGILEAGPAGEGHRALALPRVITWARCGGAGQYTVLFDPLGENRATLADLLRNLREEM